MKCPYCSQDETRVIDTSHDQRGGIRRRRVCGYCDQRFTTYERPILATPMVVKRDGTREEFSREKLLSGVRLACVKRPVSATDVEQLAGEVESELQQLGRAEVSSRQVGDRIMAKLKELDEVAYIRFASVYLRLGDLGSIRNEIDRLLKE
ncbi:MAG: transcriptional regulator NrdR [Anaerolineae bacterium]|nr:transcriptional regulator NrdR [Anaerolineae bacterium]